MIKFLKLSSFLFLLTSSCWSQQLEVGDTFSIVRLDSSHSLKYSATISAFSKEFTGLNVFKANEEKTSIVFLTEMGMKIFIFEMNENKIETKYLVPFLRDRSGVEKIFHLDYQLLTQDFLVKKIKKNKIITRSNHVFKFKKGSVVVKKRQFFSPTKIILKQELNKSPTSIQIKNRGVNLKINLRLI